MNACRGACCRAQDLQVLVAPPALRGWSRPGAMGLCRCPFSSPFSYRLGRCPGSRAAWGGCSPRDVTGSACATRVRSANRGWWKQKLLLALSAVARGSCGQGSAALVPPADGAAWPCVLGAPASKEYLTEGRARSGQVPALNLGGCFNCWLILLNVLKMARVSFRKAVEWRRCPPGAVPLQRAVPASPERACLLCHRFHLLVTSALPS